MLKRFLIFFLFHLLMSGSVHSQTENHDSLLQVLEELQQQSKYEELPPEEEYIPEEIMADTFLNVNPLLISSDSVSGWKNKKEFAYTKNLDSLLKALQEKEQAKKPRNMEAPSASFLDKLLGGPLLKILLWTMAGIFVLVIFIQLAKNKGLFRSTVSKQVEEEEVLPDVDTLEQDFDNLQRKAEAAGNYRLAVRYLFLQTLQHLRNRELIDFAAGKTNSRYVQEVPPRLMPEFAALILHYEYVWYGEFVLSQNQYESLRQKHFSFNNKI